MSITKATNSGLVGTKYNNVSADNYYMEPIASTLLGSTTTTISFSNIPQGYKHLQIRGIAKTAQSGTSDHYGIVKFNDIDLTYIHILSGGGSATAAESAAGVGRQMLIPMSGVTAFGTFVMDIVDYANSTKNKTVRTLAGYDKSGGGNVGLYSGFLADTAPIKSLTFYTNGNNGFTANTRISLYGIRG